MSSTDLRGVKPPEYRALLLAAVSQGWTATHTGSTHIRLDPPGGGKPVFAGGTSYGGRATKNLRAKLRRAGVDC